LLQLLQLLPVLLLQLTRWDGPGAVPRAGTVPSQR
jgi:hypothetical protein